MLFRSSAVMMLEHFGWNKAAELIVNALESSFGEGRATHDLARFIDVYKRQWEGWTGSMLSMRECIHEAPSKYRGVRMLSLIHI